MEIWYEDVSAATARAAMALKATVEPMLMSERRTVKAREMSTAFRGMFQPGLTCGDVVLDIR